VDRERDAEAVRRSAFDPGRDHETFMRHWHQEVIGDATILVRTVTVDGQAAGHIVTWWAGDRRFLGYWLGRPFWGHGVGTRALTRYLQEEPIRPLYADPFEGNTASVRLLEKLGFERTGTVEHGDNTHVMLVLSD
jgi:RimJ/RimL family protein N-acetyltransferase